MSFELLLKLLISIAFMGSLIIVNFILFKIPVRQNDKQIVLLAVSVGAVNFYFKFIVDSPYVILIQTSVYVVLLMILRRYPILYSFIVCLTGLILASVLDAIVTLGALQLQLTTIDKVTNKLSQFIIFHLIITSLFLFISYILVSWKIGFSFIVRRFSGVNSLKPSNFIWALILIVGAFILQITAMKINDLSFHVYIILFMVASFTVTIFYASNKNKAMVQDRKIQDCKNIKGSDIC